MEEIKEGPEFADRVLERGAGDEEPIARVEFFERVVELRRAVFEAMRFVHGHVGPTDGTQQRAVFQNYFKSGEEDVEFESAR